jgi:hypothetical protein
MYEFISPDFHLLVSLPIRPLNLISKTPQQKKKAKSLVTKGLEPLTNGLLDQRSTD